MNIAPKATARLAHFLSKTDLISSNQMPRTKKNVLAVMKFIIRLDDISPLNE
ncbi:hypothetical protein D3C84_1020250 [compost metagenome]